MSKKEFCSFALASEELELALTGISTWKSLDFERFGSFSKMNVSFESFSDRFFKLSVSDDNNIVDDCPLVLDCESHCSLPAAFFFSLLVSTTLKPMA